MTQFAEQFRDLSTEYLLQRRALGDELSEEAHQAIELVLSERGERIPPRPSSPILASDLSQHGRSSNTTKTIALFVLAVVLAGISMGLSKAIAHTWVGIVISIGLIAYAAMNWIRRQSLPAAEREEEDTKRKAAGDGLTPLMHAAASGDTSRVRESLDYGADANAVSLIGTTALMYAARNNQLDIARLLVDAGADVGIRSDKGSTAVDIAQRTGNAELSKLLSASSKRQK